MGAILKRELSSYFNSATAYVVMAVYFFFSGLFFYTYCFAYNSASLAGVYGNMFYIIMFIFICNKFYFMLIYNNSTLYSFIYNIKCW